MMMMTKKRTREKKEIPARGTTGMHQDNDDDVNDDDDERSLACEKTNETDVLRETGWIPEHQTPDEFLRQLIIHQVIQKHNGEIKEKSIQIYPDSNSVLAERKLINDMLPELRQSAKDFLAESLFSIYYFGTCQLFTLVKKTSEQLRNLTHIPMSMALREALRLHMSKLDPVLIPEKEIREENE